MAQIERVLVTGGCGFIGANLVRFLRDRTSWDLRVMALVRAGSSGSNSASSAWVMVGAAVADRRGISATPFRRCSYT